MAEHVHYVVTVDVKKVTKVPAKKGNYNEGDTPERRDIEDVSHIVTKGDSLESVIEKTKAILDLELDDE